MIQTQNVVVPHHHKYTATFNASDQTRLVKPMSTSMTQTKPPSPLVNASLHPSINLNIRQIPMDMIYKAYLVIYAGLKDCLTFAARDAAEEELHIATSSVNVSAYRVSWKHVYNRLQHRKPITSVDDTCTLHEYKLRKAEREKRKRWNAPLTITELSSLLPSKEDLSEWGYIIVPPETTVPFEVDGLAPCDRCRTHFIGSQNSTCTFHPGRPMIDMVQKRIEGWGDKKWSCCDHLFSEEGCTTSPSHVQKVTDPAELAAIRPFEEVSEHGGVDVVSLDCEMVYTIFGLELGRISLLDASGKFLMDDIVRPEGTVIDYATCYSGLTEEQMSSPSTISLSSALSKFKSFVSKKTIIIGHGLENDLSVLRLIHFNVIDTSILFPHQRGFPYRLKLQHITKRELGVEIQVGGDNGHSSSEDAGAAMMLVRKFLRSADFPGMGKVVVNCIGGQ
jgi:RNA exonuclease 1